MRGIGESLAAELLPAPPTAFGRIAPATAPRRIHDDYYNVRHTGKKGFPMVGNIGCLACASLPI
jgi:hypothetical protein